MDESELQVVFFLWDDCVLMRDAIQCMLYCRKDFDLKEFNKKSREKRTNLLKSEHLKPKRQNRRYKKETLY